MAEIACTLRDRAAPAFELESLDLAYCHTLEVNTALSEFERKHAGLSHRFETWPPDVRARIERELLRWMAAHERAVLRLVSFGLHRGVAVAVLHYVYPPAEKPSA